MELPAALPLLSLPLLWILLGLLFALVYPLIGRLVSQLPPHSRSSFQLVYAMLPAIIAGTIAMMVFTPVLGGVNVSGHCHGLNCAAHVPVLRTTVFTGDLIIVLLVVIISVTVMLLVMSIWRNNRVSAMLCKLSSNSIDNNFNVLETPELLACCAGIITPQILISRGILQQANPIQLQIIVGHELAHACRLDNLRRLLASLATLLWPQCQRRRLLADFELACEQGCDQDVSESFGRPDVVAETIRAVYSWRCSVVQGEEFPHTDFSAARISVLGMQQAYDIAGWKTVAMVLACSAAIIIWAADIVHRTSESVLSVVLY